MSYTNLIVSALITMSEVHKHLKRFSPKHLIKDGELSKESLKRFYSLYIFEAIIVSFQPSYVVNHCLNR